MKEMLISVRGENWITQRKSLEERVKNQDPMSRSRQLLY